jgi:hypothetical protein
MLFLPLVLPTVEPPPWRRFLVWVQVRWQRNVRRRQAAGVAERAPGFRLSLL